MLVTSLEAAWRAVLNARASSFLPTGWQAPPVPLEQLRAPKEDGELEQWPGD